MALGVVTSNARSSEITAKPIHRVLTPWHLPPICLELARWLQGYYPAPSGQIYSLFVPNDLGRTARVAKQEASAANAHLAVLPALNEDQQSVVTGVENAAAGKSITLHGDTGTGKTRVYIELARRTLESGRNVMLLVPEIGLAPQLKRDFEQAFQDRVLLTHSGMTGSERRAVWQRANLAAQPVVMMGPRSALFAPLDNLGLIVVDEAHEAAYKQEQAPYYDARRVASKLAKLHGARLVYGSATPLVSEYYLAEATDSPIIRLTRQAASDTVHDSAITVINLREKSEFSRSPQLSNALLDGISDSLSRKEQSLVFLNRRGTAKVVLCQNCGWQALCPNCDLPLTYHGDQHRLRCHTCGYHTTPVTSCPDCGGVDLIFRSLGTKSIADALSRLYPSARIQRFDTDTTKADRLDQHYTAISRGEIDILVGTQMLAKGLDLPRLGFVAVVSADTSLSFPDYTAAERTYQMLVQVLGRVGRGHRAGSAVVQTHQPGSPAITAALKKDWDAFYSSEIAERRTYNFPPFCHILKLTCSRKTIAGAMKAATTLSAKLRRDYPDLTIDGPSPSFYEKSAGAYRWQLIIRAKNRSALSSIASNLPAGWTADLDPSDLL
jgi:primosomal protein N' (replication factor Y)